MDLVNKITTEERWEILVNRFNEFKANEFISCQSMPFIPLNDTNKSVQISNWWSNIEQQSIELALEI